MADEILVKGASASMTPANPTVSITTSTHSMDMAPSGFASSESNEILLESDIDASFGTYTTNYSTPTYTKPGMLTYQSLASVSGLSELTKKDGDPIALKTTEGTITCSVATPAEDVSPVAGGGSPIPDTTPSYDIDFSFTDAAQTLAKSN